LRRLSCCVSDFGRSGGAHPDAASQLPEVGLHSPRIDACKAALDGERSDDIAVEEIAQDGIRFAEEAFERVEEAGCLGDATRAKQRHHVRPERREKISVAGRGGG